MRIFLMLLLSLSFSVQAKIKEPAVSLEENKLNVFFDAKNPAVFVGKKSVNVNASGAGSMVYPAGSAGVFLVSILAHAAVSGSVENKRLSMEQEAANQVLEPFANKISEVDSDFLWDEARISADLPKFKFFLIIIMLF